MIPKAQLPFLKPLSEQVKRQRMVESKRKIVAKGKKYKEPSLRSAFKYSTLKPQIKRFVG